MSLSRKFESHPIPPPPPVPSCLIFKKFNVSPKTVNTCEVTKVSENEIDLAIKRLFESDVYFNRIFHLSNCYLTPQLQDGPKCGLVALSIATSGRKDFVPVDKIYQTAVSLGLTKQGEMFSANSLALLAEKCCGFKTKVITDGLNTHFNCVISSLLRKQLLLVPYDADYNHSPCCKKGTKAHWALITGFLIVERDIQTEDSENDVVLLSSLKSCALCNCIESKSNMSLPLIPSIYQEKILIGKKSLDGISNNLRDGKFYLIGMQGKSTHVGFWLFDEMAKSNDNLVFFSANRKCDCYVLPEGGLEEGLKGKAVILDCPDFDC